MKKITSILCALLVFLGANATARVGSPVVGKQVSTAAFVKAPALKLDKTGATPSVMRAPQAPAANTLTSGTYYTASGSFYNNTASGWQDATSGMSSIEVTVNGTNVTITGLAYWFKDGAIHGTMDGNTITFANGQLVGADEDGDEFLVGSNDGETVAESIVFVYDPTKKTLTAQNTFLAESASATALKPYAYWYNAVFSADEPETPELVELPTGATVVEYKMAYTNPKDDSAGSTYINVAVAGDKVYFQGMSQYIPTSWVVGTKAGNTITFAADQYVGEYDSYSSYFFANGETVFTYDPAADTYSATGEIYGVLGGQYYDGRYKNPVLSKAGSADMDHPIEIAITSANSEYSERYSETIYTLSNASGDSIFVFDIMLPSSQTDVTPGKTYTLEDMYTSVSYTYVMIGNTKTALKSVEFVKTMDAQGLPRIEATVVDNDLNVYHLVYAFKATGEQVNLFMNTPMLVPQRYEDGTWEVYCATEAKDTVVAFVYYSDNATSPAGTFTEGDLMDEYSGIKLNGTAFHVIKANITVTDTNERIDVTGTVIADNGVQYNIRMFFLKPQATAQETISANDLTINADYFDWLGVITFEASDANNAIRLNVNANGKGAQMAGAYVAGTDFNGTVTPTDGIETEIYSGSIVIAVAENGDVTLTGTVLGANSIEYTLNLKYIKPEPIVNNIEITAVDTTQRSGLVRYILSNADYDFYFTINLASGEDVESGKTYTFADDMGADTYTSFGMDKSHNYIDYASATFVKTVSESQIKIEVSIVDVDGNTWNLTYTEPVPTAVDAINAENNAVKRIVNGQVVIEKNGVFYNILGTEIK